MPKKQAKEKKAPIEPISAPVRGRPTKYSEALGKKICRAISVTTDSMTQICNKNPDFPVRETIWAWRIDFPDFSNMYDAAKRAQADLLVEEIKDIADDSSRDDKFTATGDITCDSEWVARSRLRVDTRKWIACKLLPKVYGEHNKIENLESENAELKKEMLELKGQLDEKHKKEY
jgi:hypothetical protein